MSQIEDLTEQLRNL